jgi:hypothetical protein
VEHRVREKIDPPMSDHRERIGIKPPIAASKIQAGLPFIRTPVKVIHDYWPAIHFLYTTVKNPS